jgi:hypothetical protein
MTMQEQKARGGLTSNFWAQMAIMAVVVAVVIVLAAKLVW